MASISHNASLDNRRQRILLVGVTVVYLCVLLKAVQYNSSRRSAVTFNGLLVRSEDTVNVPERSPTKYLRLMSHHNSQKQQGFEWMNSTEIVTQNQLTPTIKPNEDFSTKTTLRYEYHPRDGDVVKGLVFNVDVPKWMPQHGMPLRNFVEPSREALEDMVFVTGASASHLNESRDAVAGVQKQFPTKKIWYYDWGLNLEQRRRVKRWCNVELREFSFDTYPVQRNMSGDAKAKYQTAKIFAIIEALHNFQTVMWIDASVRFHSWNLTALYKKAVESTGLVFVNSVSYVRTLEVTHPKTFLYLPTNMTAAMHNNHVATTAFLIMRTAKIYNNIIWWWYLCSLDINCIAPTQIVKCDFIKAPNWSPRVIEYHNCHRMDQSVLNILAGNLFNYDVNKYSLQYADGHSLLTVCRKSTFLYKNLIC